MVKGIRSWALLAALGMLLPLGASAGISAGPMSVRNQVESSLMVTGNVDIEPDGSVSRLDLDHPDKLPEVVVGFVRESGMKWKFQPVVRDGHAVKARAPMNLRVVAKKQEDGNYRITLRGVNFERFDNDDPNTVGMLKMDPPRYPRAAAEAMVSGAVYLVLKIGRDGKVQDAVAEQVNLRVVAGASEMERFRRLFANSALTAARDWTYRIPTTGKAASLPFWTVRVPVAYAIAEGAPPPPDEYGQWISYVPGPRQEASWENQAEGAGFEPDTLGDGGVYMANSNAPRLLTPLQGG